MIRASAAPNDEITEGKLTIVAIMNFTGRMLKNLFSKPATTKYPYIKKTFPAATRGHIDINVDDCIFCGICSKRCPSSAIMVDRAAKRWEISPFGCCQCGECVSVCPKKCLFMKNEYTAPGPKKISAVFTKQEEAPKEP
ncbi:MAG: 4Fe-4S dicluster domain-containing protein [Eubacteriales bacterium]